jgi:cell division protein FtsW
MTFLQMASDPLGKDYHIRQILLAIGSGGVFGLGMGQSHQKYLFLPEASTDSIFAVVLEELGFLGGLILIGLFAYLILMIFRISLDAPDDFSRVLSLGIAGWLGGQMFLNIASMVATVPLTGIPLPFFSYGGTSLITTLVACGILLNISSYGARR